MKVPLPSAESKAPRQNTMRSFRLNNNPIFPSSILHFLLEIFPITLKIQYSTSLPSSHYLYLGVSKISITPSAHVSGVAPLFHVDSLHADPTPNSGVCSQGRAMLPTIAPYTGHNSLRISGNELSMTAWQWWKPGRVEPLTLLELHKNI